MSATKPSVGGQRSVRLGYGRNPWMLDGRSRGGEGLVAVPGSWRQRSRVRPVSGAATMAAWRRRVPRDQLRAAETTLHRERRTVAASAICPA